MQDIKKILKSTYWLLIAIVSFILTSSLYSVFYAPDFEDKISDFQEEIKDLELELESFNERNFERLKKASIRNLWLNQELEKSKEFKSYVLINNVLTYWSDNKIDVNTIPKGTDKVCKLNNGFYLIKQKTLGDLTLINAVLIQSNYPYQNEDLRNKLIERLQLPQELVITTNQNQGVPIFNNAKEFLFSIKLTGGKNTTPVQELVIFSFYLLGILALFLGMGRIFNRLKLNRTIKYWSFTLSILLLRFLTLKYHGSEVFVDFDIYSPELYASSFFSPNLGEFCLNIIVYILLGWWTLKFIKTKNKLAVILLFLLSFGLSFFISNILENLILNSNIPLRVEELFNLNMYSFVVLVSVFILFYFQFLFILRVLRQLKEVDIRATQLSLLWFFASVSYFLITLFYLDQQVFMSFWPGLIIGFLLYVQFKYKGYYTFGLSVIVLALFAFYASLILDNFNQKNEYQTRELYANQLASDYDPNVELEYAIIEEDIRNAPLVKELIENPLSVKVSEFKTKMEEEIFVDFWERYEVNFYLFSDSLGSLLKSQSKISGARDGLDRILGDNKNKTGLFYIEDYEDKLSYIAREIVEFEGEKAVLYASFKSKRIPEEIGFPRLLINEKANVLEELEQYSMAKYVSGDLVMRYKDYNYPIDENSFLLSFDRQKGFVEDAEFSHYIYHYSDINTLVLTKEKVTKLSVFTNFSYLFTFFAVLLVFPWFIRYKKRSIQFGKLNLSVKIQFVLIGLVMISLIIFGYVSGSFVKSQYLSYTNDNIQERIYSVNTEVKQKLGERDYLNKEESEDYIEYILKKFSGVFVTDINLFDLNGSLLASSQPKIYKLGLLNEHMHTEAFRQMVFKKRSEYIHNENIGDLNYLSAYIPFMNNKGEKIAFLNLQYFAKQNEYETQISSFLVSIINLAVLLIVSTIVIAIFISNWITLPLKLIQRSFSSVELGKTTSPIDYTGDDEIGALVRDYNAKLAELEIKALQLAKSERESAWREMAKQVAHEIKNPLTPMKLRLQHFQRSFNPSDEKAKDKLSKMVVGLIEQIDALTNIANEFSNFAKMPKPDESLINVVPLLKNCLNVFKDTEHVGLSSNFDKDEYWVYADKNLMLRVFNNLVKNAIQAIPENSPGKVNIFIKELDDAVVIGIKDNGVGIAEGKLNKIFVPNFTTKSTGTGLGLAMVKQIVENHNGEIWFDTKEGLGSTFYVKLPLKDNRTHG